MYGFTAGDFTPTSGELGAARLDKTKYRVSSTQLPAADFVYMAFGYTTTYVLYLRPLEKLQT